LTKPTDEDRLMINTMNISKANLHHRLDLPNNHVIENGSIIHWEQIRGQRSAWVVEALRDERYYLYRQIGGSIRYDPPD